MAHKRYKPHFEQLKERWLHKHKKLQSNLWEKHRDALDWIHKSSKNLAVGSMTGLLMLTHPATSPILADNIIPPKNNDAAEETSHKTHEQLKQELFSLLPEHVQPLTSEQKESIARRLTDYFNFRVTPVLEGKQLNRAYGYIGAEQHLMRYPGDTMDTHFDTPEEHQYWASGMAPGKGAWGYFSPSREELTERDKEREKYYIAVQTFLSPGWGENVNEYYNFFKYRKMLVVNPENGKAMVVVIGDAGPAEFTGKQLGGSPEVMSYLERVDGAAKGPVLYYFIDDPEDRIPLGPIQLE